jgi:hypothetical protein
MKTNYIYYSSSLHFSATLLCSILYLLQYNNENLSKEWLYEVSRPVCNLSYQTHSGYLLHPITITNSYCQIRVNTPYLQPLIVLKTLQTSYILKCCFQKYLNNRFNSELNVDLKLCHAEMSRPYLHACVFEFEGDAPASYSSG